MNLRLCRGFAMAKIVLLFLICLVVYPSISHAQNGCVIYYGGGTYGTVVYTSPAGTTSSCNGYTVDVYNGSPSTTTSACINNPTPDNYRQCIVGSSCGVLIQNYITTCPLDENIFLLLIALGAFGYYRLKKGLPSLNFQSRSAVLQVKL
ncbi:hypothetical protein [Pedobacter sp. KBW01]|uniref:hypothetical protein n=1 Tax=Pedobacter sp. KBW01 TaxID=2153364 RepID=UPI000F5B4A6F|nr:hypothetical protein [Pedobacter sp. KBW01]